MTTPLDSIIGGISIGLAVALFTVGAFIGGIFFIVVGIVIFSLPSGEGRDQRSLPHGFRRGRDWQKRL